MGSDLDLLLVDASAEGPQHQRLLRWPLEKLPLSCDALVLTPMELEQMDPALYDNRPRSLRDRQKSG